jgi:hypothetical protein
MVVKLLSMQVKSVVPRECGSCCSVIAPFPTAFPKQAGAKTNKARDPSAYTTVAVVVAYSS